MINFEQHYADLAPVDWDGPMSACSNAELRWLEEQAAKWSEMKHQGAAGVGRALFAQVQQARALRVARQARIDVQAWAIDGLEFPLDMTGDVSGDVSGLPSWGDISGGGC